MEVAAIIQARMDSRRFPGKVLKEIKGKPLLSYLRERLEKSPVLNRIVVATSEEDSDKPIADFCRLQGIACFRGSLKNVAERFYRLLDLYPVDAFVRISGDSPLLDHRIVTEAVGLFHKYSSDIVTNVLTRTFPKGQSVEVIRSLFYRQQYPYFLDAHDREHVTPFFYRNHDMFNIVNLESGADWGAVQMSVDTCEDFLFMEKMMGLMDKPHWNYDVNSLMALRRAVLEREGVPVNNA
ncbi:MAG TPA: hypothetical protein P5244_15130 [Syntrophales bacterium]|nr:hypothetical protein [Syntrophales bacterium]